MPSRSGGFVGRSIICHRGQTWLSAPYADIFKIIFHFGNGYKISV